MHSHSQFHRSHVSGQYLQPPSRVTRVRQSVDDLSVLIESAHPDLKSPSGSYIEGHEGSSPLKKYHVHIDDKDNNSSFDFNISMDARSPRVNLPQQISPSYQPESWRKHTMDTTRYQTTRTEQEQRSPIIEKQEKSFGKLSKAHYRVISIGAPLKKEPASKPQQAVPSPQVYNYAADDSIHSEEYHLTPPHEEQIFPMSLEKHAQEMIEEPPSMPNIPVSSQKPQPIIVPISSMPKTTLNYTARNGPYHRSIHFDSKSKSPQAVKINLNEAMKERKKDDRFLKQKNRYLNKLREEERLSKSRTLSKNKRPLSASCQQITNRLYYTKTNNQQPCPRYQHYLGALKRMRMKETVSDYTFIRRYLSDRQICEIFQVLQMQGVPQHKWAMKVVDVVYSKMHQWKSY